MRKYVAGLVAVLVLGITASQAGAATTGVARPALIATISKAVFGSQWRAFACLAHYESTDGANLYNGVDIGPWQIDVHAHKWVNARRLVTDWWYSARVAWGISNHGRDFSPWPSTRRSCHI